MDWCADGRNPLLAAAKRIFRAAAFPTPPAGFTTLSRPRSMRAVLRGTVAQDREDGAEVRPVVVKWHRRRRLDDLVSHWFRGGKGGREGRALRALAAEGVACPEVLAWSESPDLLITSHVPHLRPVSTLTPAVLTQGAALLAAARRAGVAPRDVHRGNFALDSTNTLHWMDLGSADVKGSELLPAEEEDLLARAAHGLLANASRSMQLRALCAYERALEAPPGVSSTRALRLCARQRMRALAPRVREHARAYRRGRDRRPLRRAAVPQPTSAAAASDRANPAHFVAVRGRDPQTGLRADGVRFTDVTTPAFALSLVAWAAQPHAYGDSLKAGGNVRAVTGPGDEALVLKAYPATVPWRRARGWRALHRAHQLAHRHLPVATGLRGGVALQSRQHLCGEAHCGTRPGSGGLTTGRRASGRASPLTCSAVVPSVSVACCADARRRREPPGPQGTQHRVGPRPRRRVLCDRRSGGRTRATPWCRMEASRTRPRALGRQCGRIARRHDARPARLPCCSPGDPRRGKRRTHHGGVDSASCAREARALRQAQVGAVRRGGDRVKIDVSVQPLPQSHMRDPLAA